MHPTLAYFSLSLVDPKDPLWPCAALISWHVIFFHSLLPLLSGFSGMKHFDITDWRLSFTRFEQLLSSISKRSHKISPPKSPHNLRSFPCNAPCWLTPVSLSFTRFEQLLFSISKRSLKISPQKSLHNLRSFPCSAPRWLTLVGLSFARFEHFLSSVNKRYLKISLKKGSQDSI